jgi:hypothetical protein
MLSKTLLLQYTYLSVVGEDFAVRCRAEEARWYSALEKPRQCTNVSVMVTS